MPFIETTDDITAVLTAQGRDEMARLVLGESSFNLAFFQVGRGGYTDVNPVKIDPVVITDTALIDPVPDASTERPFVIIEQPIGPNVAAPICRLDPGDTTAEYGLGELGIFATYQRDEITPANVGTSFMFAVSHFPIVSKTPTHTLVWRVIIAL